MSAAETRRAAGLELVVGIAICLIGAWQSAAELPTSLAALRPSADHGVLLIGAFLVARALAELGLGLHRAGSLVLEAGVGARHWLASPRVETAVGVLVMVASLGQIGFVAAVQGAALWHFGLALLGLTMACRLGFTAHEGFERLSHHHLPPWLARVARFCESPPFQLVLALGVLVLAACELALPQAFIPAAEEAPHGGHAVALLAAMRVYQVGKDLYGAYALLRAATTPRTPHVEGPAP